MQTTANYALKKPEGTDVVNIQDFNDNSDTVDAELKKRALITQIPTVPVQSVNGKTGQVSLNASDVGAATPSQIPTSLPANGGNSTTVNNHTASATPGTTEKTDLVGMVNEVGNNLSSHKAEIATETAAGHIQLATATEVTAGTEATKAVTSKNLKTELNKKIDNTKIGVINGVASLGNDGKVPSGQLPNLDNGTWQKIATTTTATSSLSELDFASIPSGYKFLKILYQARNGGSNDLTVNFNDDKSLIYSWADSYNSSYFSGYGCMNFANGALSSIEGTFGEINISNIQNLYKRVIASYCSIANGTLINVTGTWANTSSEINKIALNANPFIEGSVFELWGCK